MERIVVRKDLVSAPNSKEESKHMDRKGNSNPPPSMNSWSLGALLAIFAILGLAGYFVFSDDDDFVVKPATGTAQAMAAASTK